MGRVVVSCGCHNSPQLGCHFLVSCGSFATMCHNSPTTHHNTLWWILVSCGKLSSCRNQRGGAAALRNALRLSQTEPSHNADSATKPTAPLSHRAGRYIRTSQIQQEVPKSTQPQLQKPTTKHPDDGKQYMLRHNLCDHMLYPLVLYTHTLCTRSV